jgi:hypothetical protein
MCPTVLGRIETRTFTLIGPAILAAILSLATRNAEWIVIIGVYLLMGVALDIVIYPGMITWQPPWMTFLLGVTEFVMLYVLVVVLHPGQPSGNHLITTDSWKPVVFYWVVWTLAIWTKVVVLPLVSLSWIENGGEFRSVDWTIRPEVEPLPLIAIVEPQAASGPLVREFSSLHAIPSQPKEALSGVHRIPGAPKNPE